VTHCRSIAPGLVPCGAELVLTAAVVPINRYSRTLAFLDTGDDIFIHRCHGRERISLMCRSHAVGIALHGFRCSLWVPWSQVPISSSKGPSPSQVAHDVSLERSLLPTAS
jgi:hypothetical protein